MENASKALLIAGAILIVILLIGVGMMVYNGATGSINQGIASMNQQEKDAFNDQFTRYEGTKVKGANVRTLLQSLSSSNSENQDIPEKCVGVDLKITSTTASDFSYAANTKWTSTQLNSLSTVRAKVNSSATYTVVCEYNDKYGLVSLVKVTANGV